MGDRRRTELEISLVAGVLAAVAFTAGQVLDDALLRALSSGLLVLCCSFALPRGRRRGRRSPDGVAAAARRG